MLIGTLMISALFASGQECRSIAVGADRLACYDKTAPDGAGDCPAIKYPLDRLDCFDAAVDKNTPGLAASEHELAWQAVDVQIAKSYRDPLSAINYRVTPPFRCGNLGAGTSAPDSECICWEVNSKNGYGGYAGTQMRWSFATDFGMKWLLIGNEAVRSAEEVRACVDAGLMDRDSSKIAEQVGK